MTLPATRLLLLPLLGAPAFAQDALLLDPYREVDLVVVAKDPATDVGKNHNVTFEELGVLEEDVEIDPGTQYPGSDSIVFSRARGFHESDLFDGGVVACMESYSYGESFDASGQGLGIALNVLETTVRATTLVRYDLSAFVQAQSDAIPDAGFANGSASVRLRGPSGDLLFLAVAAAGAHDSNSQSGARTGWLLPGEVDLEARARAETDANGAIGQSLGELDVSLFFFCAADYDLDGKVTEADRFAFGAAWLAGSPSADVDGDGSVDAVDLGLFRRAYAEKR